MKRLILVLLTIVAILPAGLHGQYFEIRGEEPAIEQKVAERESLTQDQIKRDGPVLGRIVGGSNANIADYPWQVALMTSSGFQFCGGSVIHPEWIMTAAHCLGGTIYIRAGVTNRTHTTGQDRLVIAQHGHPGFVGSTHVNDIALLRLQTPLDLSGPNVKAIPLATAAHAELGYTDPEVLASITGWGATSEGGPSSNILQVAQVPITTMEYAQAAYGPYGYTITPDMLPAGYPAGGIDACQGDSGGPIVVPDPDSPVGFLLAGATTWGIGCARPGLPGIYARASHFEDWITQVSGIVFDQPSGLLNPTQFTAQGVSDSEINITWNKNADQNDVMVLWSIDGVFGTPQDGVGYSVGQTIPGGGMVIFRGAETSITHSGLEPATIYQYKAFSYNAANEYSLGTTTSGTTLCGGPISNLPYFQDFNASTSAPPCWDVVDHIGNGQVWMFGSFPGGLSGTTGNYAYLNSDGYGSGNTQNSDLVSPEFDLSNYTSVNLSFNHYFRSWSGSSGTLQYSINGGANWTTIQQWTSNTANPAVFSQAIAAVSGQSSVQFRWKYQGTWGYSWSVDNVSITGTFVEPEGIHVRVTAAIEGAVNPEEAPLMNTFINDVLPLSHPFNPPLPYFGNPAPVWLYDGNESVGSMPGNVVDWVLVELRDAPSAAQALPATVVARQAGLLRNNGLITDTNGNHMEFDILPEQNLYVVVYHRNHLPVMSAQPLTLSAGVYTYNFTTAAEQAYGGILGHKQVLPGIWGMIGGDADANGQVQIQDLNNVWQIQSGSSGYYAGDMDLNGEVQTQDANNIWEVNSGTGSAVP